MCGSLSSCLSLFYFASLFVPGISPLCARALLFTVVGVGVATAFVIVMHELVNRQVTEVYDKVKASLTYLRGIAEVSVIVLFPLGLGHAFPASSSNTVPTRLLSRFPPVLAPSALQAQGVLLLVRCVNFTIDVNDFKPGAWSHGSGLGVELVTSQTLCLLYGLWSRVVGCFDARRVKSSVVLCQACCLFLRKDHLSWSWSCSTEG